jgi:hypothetical protein
MTKANFVVEHPVYVEYSISIRKQPNWLGTIRKVWIFAHSHCSHLNNHFSNIWQGMKCCFAPRSTSVFPPLPTSCVGDWQLWATTASSHNMDHSSVCAMPHPIRPPAADPSWVRAAHRSPSRGGLDPDGAAHLHSAPVGGTSHNSHNLPTHMQLAKAELGREKRWRGHLALWSVKPPAPWSIHSPKCRHKQRWVQPEQHRQASREDQAPRVNAIRQAHACRDAQHGSHHSPHH